MKPMLWRLCAYFEPGLPRPTNRREIPDMARHPVSFYFFLSPPPAGAFAPAAGAAAPAAGAAAPAAGAALPAAGAAPAAAGAAAAPAAAAAAAFISSA